MNKAYLILGGNQGNKNQNLKNAIQLIEARIGEITKKSGIYLTKAWGNMSQPDFYNQALSVETNLSATELLTKLLAIEKELGRTRTNEKWQERIMDIDILFFNDDIINEPNLKIPHPYVQERRFVLIPMNEIAKEHIHPFLNKSIETLLNECMDELKVSLVTNEQMTNGQ